MTAATIDKAAQGRSNNRRGKDAMRQLVRWLREHGAPHADLVTRNNANDITGCGDLGIEVTTTTWDNITLKMDQARDDACGRGLDYYGVCKKRAASPGCAAKTPADWWWVEPFGNRWALARELERLEAKVEHLQAENVRLSRLVPEATS